MSDPDHDRCVAFIDKRGRKFYAGDRVRAVKIVSLWPMHVDGWGRDLPPNPAAPPDRPECRDESVTGTITLKPDRGEYAVLPDSRAVTAWLLDRARCRGLWDYDSIERLGPEEVTE